MKKILLTIFSASAIFSFAASVPTSVVSPDGRNVITLSTDPLACSVTRDGKIVVAKTAVDLSVDGKFIAAAATAAKNVERKTFTGTEPAPFYKKSVIDLAGNEAYVDFGDWGVRLSARNDGVAYRFEIKKGGTIDSEKVDFAIPASAKCWYNRTDKFGCEETVPETAKASALDCGDKMIYLPFVYSVEGKTVAVTESDVTEYPVLNFVNGTKNASAVTLSAKFEGYPRKTERVGGWGSPRGLATGGRWVRILEHEDYLVKAASARTMPWRVFILADEPAGLCRADIVRALARPAVSGDFSWVKPGKVAWDWWNDWNLEGVPFKAGCNTKSYEYYIDFAAKTGVEYVIFDEGWSESLNIWKFHKDVDVPHLIDYANKKGVGIILWMAWAQVYGDEERVAEHFAKLGAKGFKVDFMDRGDAEIAVFLEKFAVACAKNKMLLDYHGAYRPVGMQRTFPNILNYEAIHGLEQMKWHKNDYDFMANDVRAFFLRLTAGPMDYTPGAMINQKIGKYTGTLHAPGSVGTRAHQMALMALYEAPLQMLCDSPTNYEKNMDCFRFMAATPVTWDDTVGLKGDPDTVAAVARKAKDGSWYAAAIAASKGLDYELDTSFLGEGEWSGEVYRDHPASNDEPEKYYRTFIAVKAGDKVALRLADGGGFVIRFVKSRKLPEYLTDDFGMVMEKAKKAGKVLLVSIGREPCTRCQIYYGFVRSSKVSFDPAKVEVVRLDIDNEEHRSYFYDVFQPQSNALPFVGVLGADGKPVCETLCGCVEPRPYNEILRMAEKSASAK